MPVLRAALRVLWSGFWSLFAFLAVSAAVALTLVRLLLPVADQYHAEIAAWVSGAIGHQVQIGALDARWRGLGPTLRVSDVYLLDPQDGSPIVHFAAAEIHIDLLASLRHVQLVPSKLTILGAKLALVRHRDGHIALLGLSGKHYDWSTLGLLGHSHLSLRGGEVLWREEETAHQWRLADVDVTLRSDADHHQLEGELRLPPSLGKRLKIAVELTGDPQRPAAWRGRWYAAGEALRLAPWLDRWSPTASLDGKVDLRVWGESQGARLRGLEGVVESLEVDLGPQAKGEGCGRESRLPASQPQDPRCTANLLRVAAQGFAWRPTSRGWVVKLAGLAVARGEARWPLTRLQLSFAAKEGTVPEHIALRSDFLRLQDVAALVTAFSARPPALTAPLADVRPEGDLHNLTLRLEPATGVLSGIGEFNRLTTHPWGRLPGVTGLSGTVRFEHGAGEVVLATRQARIEGLKWFREPWPVDRLAGRVAWRRDDDGWQVTAQGLRLSNHDLAIHGDLYLRVPHGGDSPYLDVALAFDRADARQVSRYLPARIMRPRAVAWFDRAFKGGRAEAGTVLFRGFVKEFPFDHGTGQFEVEFDVKDGILDYHPEWPPLRGVDARVRFSGRSMVVSGRAGRILDSTIGEAQVTIPDLMTRQRHLVVHGKATGPAADLPRLIRSTPLAKRYGPYVRDMDGQGATRLDLSLDVPLYRGDHPQAVGTVSFSDNTLRWRDADVSLERVSGDLGFAPQGLSGSGLRCRVLGLDARVAVHTRGQSEGKVTVVEAQGTAQPEQLRQRFALPVWDYLSGRAAWRATLGVPAAAPGHPLELELRVDSDLDGVAVTLPAPLGKPARQSVALTVRTTLGARTGRVVRLDYGEVLRAALELDTAHKRLTRGAIQLGPGRAVLPAKSGLEVRGTLAELSADDWLQVLAPAAPRSASPRGRSGLGLGMDAPKDWSAPLRSVDLHFQAVKVGTQRFTDLQVAGKKSVRGWSIHLEGPQVKGTAHLPPIVGGPVRLDLKHLYLVSAVTGERRPVDPRRLPPLRAHSDQLFLNGVALGKLELVASPRPTGLAIDRLALTSARLTLNGRGRWGLDHNGQYCEFEMDFASKDLGDALTSLGYVGAIRGGASEAHLDAHWHGPPTGFALEKLSGRLRLTVAKGRILKIEPGAGRIFGLLGVQSLPRRLSLDFSDLFEKGFSFDRIEGDFSLEEGNAYCRELVVKGPAARIEMSGRIGLAARDYDQLVVVTPHFSEGLPLAGALAAGSLGVGVAILVAQKLLQPQIEKMGRIYYSLRGSWDEPVVERLDGPPTKSPASQG